VLGGERPVNAHVTDQSRHASADPRVARQHDLPRAGPRRRMPGQPRGRMAAAAFTARWCRLRSGRQLPPDAVRPRFGTDAPPRGALLVISTEHPAPMIAASRHLYINSFVRESF